MSSPTTFDTHSSSTPNPQADIQGSGVKLNADGKLWVSTKGNSRYLYQAKKCLESGYLYSIHFDYSSFNMLMEQAGIPEDARKQFVSNLEVDDEVYVCPAKMYS